MNKTKNEPENEPNRIVCFPDQDTGEPVILFDHNSNMYNLLLDYLTIQAEANEPGTKIEFDLNVRIAAGQFNGRIFYKFTFKGAKPEKLQGLVNYLDNNLQMYA